MVFLIELILFRKSFELSKIVCSGWKIRPDLAPDQGIFISNLHCHLSSAQKSSLTTGLCLHWKRWQYLKKGKHLGHKYVCAVPVCGQRDGTCLCATQPAHIEVAVQLCLWALPAPRACLWPVPSPWCPGSSIRTRTHKGCIKPSTRTAQYRQVSGHETKKPVRDLPPHSEENF